MAKSNAPANQSKSKKNHQPKLSSEEYEAIGRQLEHVVASGYANKKRLLFVNLISGIATGAGSVVGAALVLVILLWILSGLENIPFIGESFENARQTIENSTVK